MRPCHVTRLRFPDCQSGAEGSPGAVVEGIVSLPVAVVHLHGVDLHHLRQALFSTIKRGAETQR